MLERATACLEPRIWCSRATRKQPCPSSRLLHSAFWNHGAGSLDLPPYAFDFPRDASVLSPSTQRSLGERGNDGRTEAPFLDFLYPPQTLALLQRPSSNLVDNVAKRRPTPGCRKYSSTPIRMGRWRDTSNAIPLGVLASGTNKTKLNEASIGPATPEDDSRRDKGRTEESDIGSVGDTNVPSGFESALKDLGETDQTELYDLFSLQRDAKAGSAQLSHKENSRLDDSAQGQLRTWNKQETWDEQETLFVEAISAATRDQNGLQRLEALYRYLPEASKKSPAIMQQLVIWLAPLQRTKAQHWQRRLMLQMPVEEYLPSSLWTTSYCYVAVVFFLRRNELDRVRALLHGAMDRFLEGDFGASVTMEYLVRSQKWTEASELFRDLRKYREDGGDPAVLNTAFGRFHATQLKEYLMNFFEYIRQRHEGTVTSEVQELRGRLVSQFVSSLETADSIRRFQKLCFDILDLLECLAQRGLKVSKDGQGVSTDYEPLLLQLLFVTNPHDKSMHSRLVADAWNLYSRTAEFRPSDTLMIRLLQAWDEQKILNPIPPCGPRKSFTPESVRAAWLQCHAELGYVSRSILIKIHARSGDVEKVEELVRGYASILAGKPADPDFFWPYIQFYGFKRDAKAALAAFESISKEFNAIPDGKSWDMLQYAYMRADDFDGAVHTFQRRINAGVPLTAQSITTLMVLYSKQGNSDGVLALLKEAETNAISINTHMKDALLLAHANAGEVDEALEVLELTIQEHEQGVVSGPLTNCFNSVMSMFAKRREFVRTIAVYNRMRKMEIPLDVDSYSAIILALCLRRNVYEAWRTIQKIMPSERIEATAFQYTTVMTGFIKLGSYPQALNVWKYMQEHSVEPTISTRAAFIRAKAMQEHQASSSHANSDQTQDTAQSLEPLEATIRELFDALDQDQKFSLQSEFGMRNIAPSEAESTLFESLIYLHGRRRCFDAAWQLFQTYNDRAQVRAGTAADEPITPPFRLTVAMMTVYFNSGQHDEVQNCWDLLLRQATAMGSTKYSPASSPTGAGLNHPFPLSSSPAAKNTATSPHVGQLEFSRPTPNRRFLLSMPFRYYLSSVLNSPSVPAETTTALVRTLISLLASGWSFDNMTWNILIQRLCATDPTRAMFAFSLTERFLIPQFPGWQFPRRILTNVYGSPSTSRNLEQMQYIDFPQRYKAPGDRIPVYRTMVWLAYALLELRRIEAIGLSSIGTASSSSSSSAKELRAQVGSTKEIAHRAPKTLEHVRNLPVVLDDIQRRLIRKGDDVTQGGRWFGQV